VVAASRVQQAGPVRDITPAAQQCPTFPLRHATPHAEVDAVVQGFGQTLRAYGAAHADSLGPVLLGSLDEQPVRIGVAARRKHSPVGTRRRHLPGLSPPRLLFPSFAAGTYPDPEWFHEPPLWVTLLPPGPSILTTMRKTDGMLKLAGLCVLAGILVAGLLFPVVGGLGVLSNKASETVKTT